MCSWLIREHYIALHSTMSRDQRAVLRLTNERNFPVPTDPRSCGIRHPGATMGRSNSHQLSHCLEGEVHEHRHHPHRSRQERLRSSWHGRHRRARTVAPQCPRARLLELIASLPPCPIGMEACSGAHHWAREFQRFCHTVRLMAPKLDIPYRLSGKRGKNDAADAAATRATWVRQKWKRS